MSMDICCIFSVNFSSCNQIATMSYFSVFWDGNHELFSVFWDGNHELFSVFWDGSAYACASSLAISDTEIYFICSRLMSQHCYTMCSEHA